MQNPIPIKKTRQFCDIPYVARPDGKYQLFDLYVPEGKSIGGPPPPVLCFVHGGAWRAEDKSTYALLARRLSSLTSWVVAIPNYRLTTPESKLKHPGHAEDILAFLHFLLDWRGPAGVAYPYDSSRIYAIGHSCSTHMLTSIFLERTPAHAPAPTLIPSARLKASVKGFIMSEGIYDIDMLLRSFPGYRDWFIVNTFGNHESYAPWGTMDMPPGEDMEHVGWLLIHSQEDTLIDIIQSEGMVSSLKAMCGNVEYIEILEGEHNDILQGEEYARLVSEFVLRCEA